MSVSAALACAVELRALGQSLTGGEQAKRVGQLQQWAASERAARDEQKWTGEGEDCVAALA